MDTEKKENCFPAWKCNKKLIVDALTIGFVAGAAATVGLIKLIEKIDPEK